MFPDEEWNENINHESFDEELRNSSTKSIETSHDESEDVDPDAQRSLEDGLTKGNIRDKVTAWTLLHITTLTQKCIDDLLLVLISENTINLPKSSKTLLQISQVKTDVQHLLCGKKRTYGEFKYFGIANNLNVIIDTKIFKEKVIHLLFHIDGMEIYSNSKNGCWTILGKIFTQDYLTQPFLIALLYGRGKPYSAREFFF